MPTFAVVFPRVAVVAIATLFILAPVRAREGQAQLQEKATPKNPAPKNPAPEKPAPEKPALEKASKKPPKGKKTKPPASDFLELAPPLAPSGPASGGVWDKDLPEGSEDLLVIQKKIQSLLGPCRKATVNILGGSGSGSGVIINADGLILTAGHISEEPDREVVVKFEDGTKTKGVTLGASWLVDSGMIQITEKGKTWPHVNMAEGAHYDPGDWCFALGYPDGYQKDRGVVMRLGRIIEKLSYVVRSDCRLLGGDSGGPLFNMNGDVIGIHSRISFGPEDNYHAPIEAYTRDWETLLSGEVVKFLPRESRGFLGVSTAEGENGEVVVREIIGDSAAAKADIEVGDVILKVNSRVVHDPNEFRMFIGSNRIDEKIILELKRDDELKVVEVVLGEWPKFPFIEP